MSKKATKAPKIETLESDEASSDSSYAQILYFREDWRVVWEGLQYIVQYGRKNITGKKAGQLVWINKAYIGHFGEVLLWFARRQIYTIPGTYGGQDALTALNDALARIEVEVRDVMKEFFAKRWDTETGNAALRKKLTLPGVERKSLVDSSS